MNGKVILPWIRIWITLYMENLIIPFVTTHMHRWLIPWLHEPFNQLTNSQFHDTKSTTRSISINQLIIPWMDKWMIRCRNKYRQHKRRFTILPPVHNNCILYTKCVIVIDAHDFLQTYASRGWPILSQALNKNNHVHKKCFVSNEFTMFPSNTYMNRVQQALG